MVAVPFVELHFCCTCWRAARNSIYLRMNNSLVHEPKQGLADRWIVNPSVAALKPSAIREILKIASAPGMISFAGGLPAPELFPREALATIAAQVINDEGDSALQYSLTRGIAQLRRLLAERATARGTATDAQQIHITTGSQQGLELIGRLFIRPGDAVMVENPTYIGALQAFNCYQPRYVPVPIDRDGIKVDEVEALLKHERPKFIYVVPDFQNPTGVTMSLERRKRLVAIAGEYDVPIIDDSPYADLRFAGTPLPSLKSLGGSRVIALRTFSKLIAPGLRVGWINADDELIGILERVKQACDLHSSTLDQVVVHRFLADGLLEPHLTRVRADYGQKRELMISSMQKCFPPSVRWTEPEGGLFLWVTLPDGMSSGQLVEQALAEKVAVVPGRTFFARGDNDSTLRLNFSNTTPQAIDRGIAILGTLMTKTCTTT